MRSEGTDERLEHEFFRVYRETFGTQAPRTLRLAYTAVSEALYFGLHGGLGIEDQPGGIATGKRYGADRWPLKDWRVLPLKTRVDAALSAATAVLRAWQAGQAAHVRQPRTLR